MKKYICRECGKYKPASEVITVFTAYNQTVERKRFKRCDDCEKKALRRYYENRKSRRFL
jgi:hypothetical protein